MRSLLSYSTRFRRAYHAANGLSNLIASVFVDLLLAVKTDELDLEIASAIAADLHISSYT
jgi:hypothetical protein